MRQEECLQHLFEGRFSTAGISNVVRQQIPDNGTGDGEGPTSKCGAVVPWYVKTVTLGWSQSLTTSETGDQDAAVGQVVRRLVVQTPVNCRREFKLDPICHIKPVQVDM